MSDLEAKRRYWQANLRLVAACLIVWFVVSFGFGIVLAGPLDQVSIFGIKLGFWFAQQGSIFCFIAIIFFYAWRMNRLDREHDVDEE
jgi:putative solute:sodium symporter small subunit